MRYRSNTICSTSSSPPAATVVKVNALTSGALGLPDHVEVGLL
jgi:hypothetical protein